MKNKTTSLDQEVQSHHQPILLTRSDTFQLYQAIPSPPITAMAATATAASEGDDSDNESSPSSSSPRQEKRKWDQVADDSSKTNISKVLMQEHSSQLLPSTTNEDDEASQDSDDPHASLTGKRLGRKPMADEEPSDDGDPKVKRKAQNRAAQRAFRDRKERYVKELELKLKQVQDTHVMATNHLFQENHQLRSIIYRLETENVALKGIHIQHGPLSGKPAQQWMEALQDHQQRFPSISMASIPSSQNPMSLSSLATLGSVYAQHSQGIMSSSSSLVNLAPAPTMPNTASLPSPIAPQPLSSEAAAVTSEPRQQQNRVQYTFSISTPATLRSRHKQQQQQQSPSSLSPPVAPKQQRSPVELVRLYPHEHSTIASSDSSMVPALPTDTTTASSPIASGTASAHPPPQSPASSVSASTHGSISAAQTPTIECQAFCDKLQEEVCTNAFDQLLSEPLFDTTTGGLNTSLGFPHLDEERPLIYHQHPQDMDHRPLSPSSPSSPTSSQYGTTADDSDKSISASTYHDQQHKHHHDSSSTSTSTHFLSGQEIYDRLHQHSRFDQYSSNQLLTMVKSMAKCTHLGPVVTEQDIQIVLTKMDQGRV